jgi:hypothetical protein
MSIALDHVFVLCEPGAPEGDALVRAGLREGSRNAHPGQGTANRRFFFSNAYLELLWVTDAREAQSEGARATRLYDRWVGRGGACSPFGIVLRPTDEGGPPFPTWPYRPLYLPRDVAIDVAVGTALTEPEYFHLGFARGPQRGGREPAAHGIPAESVRTLRIDVPGPEPASAAARAVAAAGIASFQSGRPHFLEIVFDGGGASLLDLRPELPLALRY